MTTCRTIISSKRNSRAIPNWTRMGGGENAAALGFLGQVRWFYDKKTTDRSRVTAAPMNGQLSVDVSSRGLLGLTVGCARCHDQNTIRQQLPTKDYYTAGRCRPEYRLSRVSPVPHNPPHPQSGSFESRNQQRHRGRQPGGRIHGTSQPVWRIAGVSSPMYMHSAWKVTGKRTAEPPCHRPGQLDYELDGAFIRFLAKPPKLRRIYGVAGMIKRGNPAEANKLATNPEPGDPVQVREKSYQEENRDHPRKLYLNQEEETRQPSQEFRPTNDFLHRMRSSS